MTGDWKGFNITDHTDDADQTVFSIASAFAFTECSHSWFDGVSIQTHTWTSSTWTTVGKQVFDGVKLVPFHETTAAWKQANAA